MTLLDEALTLLRELRPHAPIESAWLTDPNARFDEEAWRNSPVATSSKMRDRIDDLLARASQETSALCPHGMPLAENVCGPCSEGEPNTWRCTICNLLNPADATHCRQCEYSRTIMLDGKRVPRDGQR